MIFETLLIGILVALIFSEVLDIYPGGIIVPAYFALYFDLPLRIVATLFVAFLSLFILRQTETVGPEALTPTGSG